MDERNFSDWLRQLRRARDLTQEALAEQVGCAVDTLRAIENGRRRPSRELAAIIAERLAVPEAERRSFLDLARGLVAARPPEAPSPAVVSTPVPSLRATTAPLIGRAAELEALSRRLRDRTCRLLTLISWW